MSPGLGPTRLFTNLNETMKKETNTPLQDALDEARAQNQALRDEVQALRDKLHRVEGILTAIKEVI